MIAEPQQQPNESCQDRGVQQTRLEGRERIPQRRCDQQGTDEDVHRGDETEQGPGSGQVLWPDAQEAELDEESDE